jgi:hypothetical protein
MMNRTDIWLLVETQKAARSGRGIESRFVRRMKGLVPIVAAIDLVVISVALMLV